MSHAYMKAAVLTVGVLVFGASNAEVPAITAPGSMLEALESIGVIPDTDAFSNTR